MNRRTFLKTSAAIGLGATCFPYINMLSAAPARRKVLVLGIDGMDVGMTQHFLQQGLLPNLERVLKKGGIHALTTSTPPQSPVAWSNVIMGSQSFQHGIYDFIHRDAATMFPYLSTSRVNPPSRVLHLGQYTIPLAAGKVEDLKQGTPFWEYLAEQEISTTIFKMPVNFPCKEGKIDMVSGMGTPDLRGGYGNFTLFTTTPQQFKEDITGGIIVPMTLSDNVIRTELPGPKNTMKEGRPTSNIPITIWRDRVNPVVRILFQDHELLLKEQEWSGWLQVSFPMIGSLVDVKGICKIFVKSVHPDLTIYVSPLNIDPSEPALPVVSSEKYGKLLTKNAGFFYTQGFPEDTKALSEGIFTESEYLGLADQIFAERKRLLDFEFQRFNALDQGLLFFYFSSLDQNSHMYWRMIDPEHPLYEPELQKQYGDTLKNFYTQVDGFVGEILAHYDINDPNLTLMLMSDHGFCPFRRQVNLNTWLYENGYMALYNAGKMEEDGYFADVNWKRTGAYNVGINSLYLNIQGREKYGFVTESQAQGLRNTLREELLQLVDPETGKKAVSSVRIVPDAERQRHPHAPDLVIGWNYGYRTSWKSILGGMKPDVFEDNLDKWSGDHCVDSSFVPAIFVSNKRATKSEPNLCDIAPTILGEFGIGASVDMTGKSLYNST